MPAVAQISVDFSRRSEIISSPTLPPTNVKSVNPLTLTQYLLYNRELPLDNNGINVPSNLSYTGGFITAGDRINVKHNDLQLRQNLEVGKYVQTEFVFSRTRENNDSYLTLRQNNTRAVTIAPRVEDINLGLPDNVYIRVSTEPNKNSIDLFTKRTADESSIIINNTSSDVSITQRTSRFTLIAPTVQVTGTTTHTGNITITGITTINNTVNVRDNFNLGTTSFNSFNVTATTGNVAFIGNLNINSGKFTVASATGNTLIDGTLTVNDNTTIKGETTLEKKVTFNQGNANSDNRRITGLRRLVDIAEFNTSAYDNDALSVGDFKKFGFKTGMIMLWSGAIAGNLDGTNGLGVGPLLGWALCNGSNGTPDLRNRFVVGAGTGSNYTQGQADVRANPNNHDHGGTNNFTLLNTHLPVSMPSGVTNNTGAHRHAWGGFTSVHAGTNSMFSTVLNYVRAAGCSEPRSTARFAELQERGAGGGEVHDSGVTIYDVSSNGSHQHTVTISNAGGGQGHNHTIDSVDHRPYWYALCYIMKL
jgi:hypothetical protein